MIEIAPSMICADYTNLGREIKRLEEAGADRLHFDVMDGHFVPNLTIGTVVIEAVRPLTELFFETHLMMLEPDEHVERFVISGSNAITVHVETCPQLMRTLQLISSFEVEAGVALNPATPPSVLEYVLGDLDYVTIMTVNPGFAGQQFLEAVLPKVEHLREMIERHGVAVQIEVDGGLTVENAARIAAAGADRVVGGSSVFAARRSLRQTLAALRRELAKGEAARSHKRF
jgi:ribulose-phosphate 3-epimerase